MRMTHSGISYETDGNKKLQRKERGTRTLSEKGTRGKGAAMKGYDRDEILGFVEIHPWGKKSTQNAIL